MICCRRQVLADCVLGAFSPVHLPDCTALSVVTVAPTGDEWWGTLNPDAGI